jgi:hypothetical protein
VKAATPITNEHMIKVSTVLYEQVEQRFTHLAYPDLSIKIQRIDGIGQPLLGRVREALEAASLMGERKTMNSIVVKIQSGSAVLPSVSFTIGIIQFRFCYWIATCTALVSSDTYGPWKPDRDSLIICGN